MNRKALHRPIENVGSADVTRCILTRWRPAYASHSFTDCL